MCFSPRLDVGRALALLVKRAARRDVHEHKRGEADDQQQREHEGEAFDEIHGAVLSPLRLNYFFLRSV